MFNHLLSNGKGFAFLQMINEEARRPVSYATQRFASSSYKQWIKIEKGCDSRIRFCPQCFGASGYLKSRCRFDGSRTSPRHTDLEVEALVAKSEKLMKAVNEDPEPFPRLKEVEQNLEPGGVFKGVTLLSGWIVTSDGGKDSEESRF